MNYYDLIVYSFLPLSLMFLKKQDDSTLTTVDWF